MQSVSLSEVMLWYLKDEYDKYQHREIDKDTVDKKWEEKNFGVSIDEIFSNIDNKKENIDLNRLVKFFMCDLRLNTPEPLYFYVSNKKYDGKWFSEQVSCDEVWMSSFGIRDSEMFTLFKNEPALKSIVRFTAWLTKCAKEKLSDSEFKSVKHYLPQNPNEYPKRRPMKIAILRNSSSDNQKLKYKLLQGLHRIIQACYEGQKKIDAFICIDII